MEAVDQEAEKRSAERDEKHTRGGDTPDAGKDDGLPILHGHDRGQSPTLVKRMHAHVVGRRLHGGLQLRRTAGLHAEFFRRIHTGERGDAEIEKCRRDHEKSDHQKAHDADIAEWPEILAGYVGDGTPLLAR